MNTVENDDQVSVHLTDCDREAANEVFAVLEAAFPQASPPAGPKTAGEVSAATVWSRTVNVRDRGRSGAGGAAAPGRDAAATAALYGAADPVRQVREALEQVFASEYLGTVPGEHELEVHLRLTGRGHG
ncbi:hypothetical protein [Streptomyces sp. NPDC012888]|uniref:hypothetical protein n=1 Tax=Streptomyces sp. NPDC012888 TaxID=3364855 RepID=UPI0036BEADF1